MSIKLYTKYNIILSRHFLKYYNIYKYFHRFLLYIYGKKQYSYTVLLYIYKVG